MPCVFGQPSQAPDQEIYVFEFRFDHYPELPPLIDAVHPESGERNTSRCFPTGGKNYFHSGNFICARWSRRAYRDLGGPHGDWQLGDWKQGDPMRRELGLVLALIADLLEDSEYKGRKNA